MVGKLVALAGQNRHHVKHENSNAIERYSVAADAVSARQRPIEMIDRRPQKATQTNEIRPEEFIPMDEHEFKDF